MEPREQGYEDDRFQSDVSQILHCAICLNVFKDPVMCQRNQHFFCRPCITRHLENSQNCPTCKEELTLETLNRAPRILRDWLSKLNICCNYFKRGCREFLRLTDLESHVKNCGFSPVVCSNQGCLVEINKQDKTHHETEICEFRKVKCHDSIEVRKEIGEMKMNQTELNNAMQEMKLSQTKVNNAMQEMKMNQTELNNVMQEMKIYQTGINREMKMSMTILAEKLEKIERNVNNEMQEMSDGINESKTNMSETKDQATLTHQMVHNIQGQKVKATHKNKHNETDSTKTKLNVVVGGGHDGRIQLNSVEKFCWSNKSWSPLQPMKERRQAASSFVFENQIMVTGGWNVDHRLDTVERVNINTVMDNERWFDFPAKLPATLCGHSSVVYDEKLIIIGGYDGEKTHDSIHEVLLVPPYTSELLTRMPKPCSFHGVQLFDDKILICGGRKTSGSVDSVIMYDISKNKCKQMLPLPYALCDMATVSWGDNVIVIGGTDKDHKALNSVVIYNVKTEKSHRLPAMKYKRRGCLAVVVDNAIVVMGGVDERGSYLKSVESFSFDRYSWEDLPPMNEVRAWATTVAW